MFTIKQDQIRQAFDTAGYDDVMFDDVITARRSDGSEWEITLDRGGQMKVTVSAPDGKASEQKLTLLGRSALALSERTKVTTVLFKLTDASELGPALEALEKAL